MTSSTELPNALDLFTDNQGNLLGHSSYKHWLYTTAKHEQIIGVWNDDLFPFGRYTVRRDVSPGFHVAPFIYICICIVIIERQSEHNRRNT